MSQYASSITGLGEKLDRKCCALWQHNTLFPLYTPFTPTELHFSSVTMYMYIMTVYALFLKKRDSMDIGDSRYLEKDSYSTLSFCLHGQNEEH